MTTSPAGTARFAGFGEGAVEFYDGLAADNSKAYWTDHRAVYERDVLGPMRGWPGPGARCARSRSGSTTTSGDRHRADHRSFPGASRGRRDCDFHRTASGT